MKTCSDKEQATCNVEKMGCKWCYYDNKADEDLVVQMEVKKFINMLRNGTVSINYSPELNKYRFIDRNGNGIEVESKVYMNIVNYLEGR